MAEKAAEKAAEQTGSISANEFLGIMGGAIKDAIKIGVQEVNPHRANPNYVEDSVYRPRGVEKPELRKRVVFCSMEQERDMLTPEEVELLNQLPDGDHDYQMVMMGVPKEIRIRERHDGELVTQRIDFPLSIEERAYCPSLKKICRALIAGVSEIE